MEVLFYTDSSGNPYNINSVDISNWQPYLSFEGGTSLSNTLCFLGDYVVSALPNESILNVFEMTERGQQRLEIPTPGVAKSLCISNDGCYIAAGISKQVLVWNGKSGELLETLSDHDKDVTQLCFAQTGSFLVSADVGGELLLWDMADVTDTSSIQEPYVFSEPDTTSPVTRVECSFNGGWNSRVYSSSDETVTIHVVDRSTTSTSMSLSILFGEFISSFCVNSDETMIIAGSQSGCLYKVDLESLPEELVAVSFLKYQSASPSSSFIFGHNQSVTCLVFKLDATRFVSGSSDQTIKVWDESSDQLLHTINTKDSVTNLHLFIPSGDMLPTEPLYPFPKLSKSVSDANPDEKPSASRQKSCA